MIKINEPNKIENIINAINAVFKDSHSDCVNVIFESSDGKEIKRELCYEYSEHKIIGILELFVNAEGVSKYIVPSSIDIAYFVAKKIEKPTYYEKKDEGGLTELVIVEDNRVIRIQARTRLYINYNDYIKSDKWKNKRNERFKIDDYTCQLCNAKGTELNAHHKTYERLGNEEISDIITLCKKCHERHHEIR